jgi:hypothetical protein
MPDISEDKKLEILNDHYKESCAHLKEFLRTRDFLFLGVLIAVTVMLYGIFQPQKAGDAVSQFITGSLNLENQIEGSFIDSVIWFALFVLTLRYFQNIISIERQYDYIHMLEERLCEYYDKEAFTREGKFYKKNYPLFTKWAWLVYTVFFPFLLLIVVSVRILEERCQSGHVVGLSAFNIIMWLAILISVFFYILAFHFSEKHDSERPHRDGSN